MIRDVYLGFGFFPSRIRIPDAGGQKSTGSRIRIRNTALQSKGEKVFFSLIKLLLFLNNRGMQQ